MRLIRIIKDTVLYIQHKIHRCYRLYQKKTIENHELKECRAILKSIERPKVLNRDQIHKIRTFYRQYTSKRIPIQWHTLYYNANNYFDVRYLPVDLLFTTIIPHLNNPRFIEAYADKSTYEKQFPQISHPKTLTKKVNGSFYLNDEIVNEDEVLQNFPKEGMFIVKPITDTSQGKGIEVLDCRTLKSSDNIIKKLSDYGDNYIIQEKVISHPVIGSLNPSSLNTLRFITYRKDDKVYILSVTLKIGKEGEIVDNGHFGGFFCGVSDNGKLGKYIYTLNPFTKQIKTENGIKIEGIEIPNYDKIKMVVQECALKLPYARYVGWDIAINKDGDPVLIEINLRCPGGNIMQIPNGPLFGQFTNDILKEVTLTSLR